MKQIFLFLSLATGMIWLLLLPRFMTPIDSRLPAQGALISSAQQSYPRPVAPVQTYTTQQSVNWGNTLWNYEVCARPDQIYLPFVSQQPGIAALTSITRSFSILVDDFNPRPYPGESRHGYNRLMGNREPVNGSILEWGRGQVTTTISSKESWGGVRMSLNHPLQEELPINFSAILPSQILPAYQSQITGITTVIIDGPPGKTFKLELKDKGKLSWKKEIILNGGPQVVSSHLPPLENVNELLWVLDDASPGDQVILDSICFTATTQITDTATAAFVYSYGMLLNNWNPVTGLVRDKAKDTSGEFDAIQATGSLAAATAIAEQFGVISHTDAVQIVGTISDTLLLDVPRFHGLWPHFVEASSTNDITIAPFTEWSSVDTVIAAIGLLTAQSSLGMDTSGTEQMLRAIDWNDLVTSDGISHGYSYTGAPIPHSWDIFGGESWLVELTYAGATGQATAMTYPTPPTANGSGFIDELAWLFISPPAGQDYWGTDWISYREKAAVSQISYYPRGYPNTYFSQIGLFGLSAAEVPAPSSAPSAYEDFGVGGRFTVPKDGAGLLDAPVVVPHYSALIASLYPQEAIRMWAWLIDNGYITPLTNVESLMFVPPSGHDSPTLIWNPLKGSWNLSLQTLGWGRYLAERDGQYPTLWRATTVNPLLCNGYHLIAQSDHC